MLMGASFSFSSTVKLPREVSNLSMGASWKVTVGPAPLDGRGPLALGHALVTGEIAVGAYVTEAALHKRARHFRAPAWNRVPATATRPARGEAVRIG